VFLRVGDPANLAKPTRIHEKQGYRRRKDKEEGRIQKKEGYRRRKYKRWKDIEDGRIQKMEGYRRVAK
jgi:hypothetical protein